MVKMGATVVVRGMKWKVIARRNIGWMTIERDGHRLQVHEADLIKTRDNKGKVTYHWT